MIFMMKMNMYLVSHKVARYDRFRNQIDEETKIIKHIGKDLNCLYIIIKN